MNYDDEKLQRWGSRSPCHKRSPIPTFLHHSSSISSLASDTDTLIDNELSSQRKTISTLNRQLTHYETQLTNYQDQLSKQQEALESTQTQLTQCQRQRDQYQKQVLWGDEQLEGMDQEIAEIQNRHQLAVCQLDRRYQQQTDKLWARMERAEVLTTKLTEKVETLTRQREKDSRALMRTRKAISETGQLAMAMVERMDECQERVGRMEQRVQGWINHCCSVEKEMEIPVEGRSLFAEINEQATSAVAEEDNGVVFWFLVYVHMLVMVGWRVFLSCIK